MKKIENVLLDGWKPYIWLALLAVTVYAISLSFDFTFLDDNEFILENYGFIRDISNAGKAFTQTIFSNNFVPYYRPVLSLSLMLDAQIGGVSLFVYHLTNIVLHLFVVCLVFLLVSDLTRRRQAAFVYASLFCVHPLLVQGVAWIPGRNDILLGIFILLSFLSLIRFSVSGSFRTYLSSMIFFGIALFTKESAVMVPVIFAIFLLLGHGMVKRGKFWAWLIFGWAINIILWFCMRNIALINTYDMSTVERMTGAVIKSAPAFIQYVGKIFLPFNLSVFPTIHDTTFVYGTISILFLIALFILGRQKDWQLIVSGAVWFSLFLAFSFIRPSPECVLDFQEHRLYVPLLGLIIMLLGMGFLRDIDLRRPLVFIIFAGVLFVFSVLTFRHEMHFKDKWAFWGNAVQAAPNSGFVRMRYGFICYLNGLADKAEAAYKEAIAMDPELTAVHAKLGLLYMDKKLYNEAGEEFRKEIRLLPKYDIAYMCLGVVRYKQGKADDAVKLWRRALRLNPASVDACKNLAIYYQGVGDKARAICYTKQLINMGVNVPKEFIDKM